MNNDNANITVSLDFYKIVNRVSESLFKLDTFLCICINMMLLCIVNKIKRFKLL